MQFGFIIPINEVSLFNVLLLLFCPFPFRYEVYMSEITIEVFRGRFPEFDDISDERVQLALDDTSPYVSETLFGDFYDQAYSHLAAVFLTGMVTTAGRDGSGKGCTSGALPVTSQQAGNVLLKTADPTPVNDSCFDTWLSLTVYGQRFLAAREQATVSGSA